MGDGGTPFTCVGGTCIVISLFSCKNFGLCARTEVLIRAGRTPFDSDMLRQDYFVNCRGVVGSIPDKVGKINNIRFCHKAKQYAMPASGSKS